MLNIDKLTIGEVKEFQKIFGGMMSNQTEVKAFVDESDLYSRFIGRYVIVRSRNEGINAGFVVEASKNGVILKEARRLYYHKPLDSDVSWYEGVANSGISSDSKVSAPVIEKAIIEDYSIILCSEDAQKSISGIKSHGQS